MTPTKKIGIGCGALLGVVMLCVVAGLLVGPQEDKTPTPTAVAVQAAAVAPTATPVPTVPPTAAPEPTSVPTATPEVDDTAEVAAYLDWMVEHVGNAGTGLTELGKLSTRAGADNTLLLDQDWRIDVTVTLAMLRVTGDTLQEYYPVPAGLEEIDGLIVLIGRDLVYISTEYAAGVDDLDATRIVNASERMTLVGERAGQLTPLVEDLRAEYGL